MAVFAASVRIGIAEADVCRSVQAECDRKERHGSNSRGSDFPQCTQHAHCGKVYHNPLPAVKQGRYEKVHPSAFFFCLLVKFLLSLLGDLESWRSGGVKLLNSKSPKL